MNGNDLEGIAIIGMAGKFPGAPNVDIFWKNLCAGVESITVFSDEELLAAGADPELVRSPTYVKAGGILGDADMFEPAFFGAHPREAALMDPQHRVFLECAWQALENAGYSPDFSRARFGVFAGQSMNTYMLTNVYSHVAHVASVESLQASIGNDKDSLTTEVAYRMNFTGPAVTIQSSSSTSLVAIHYACQSLLNYETDVALAGGATIHFPEKAGYVYHEGGTHSPDGHTRAYDAEGKGFVAGNGVGVVALKRLEEALRDRDFIYAVIRATAVNNDGALRVSYMAPTVNGQAEVIAIAQTLAGVTPEDVGYIEGHGTGTLVGDPIEVTALTQAFRAGTDKCGFCRLGSVKPNIGHLDVAAGVTGLIKAALALHHKRLPPTLHFKTPNPNIDFANSPFSVVAELTEWQSPDKPRIAGVSSFGMGGTNAHAILQEAPERAPSGPSRPAQLLLLSARTPTALDTLTDNLVAHLCEHSDEALADVAYTLHIGRKRLNQRRMLVCRDLDDALTALSAGDPERLFSNFQEPKSRPVMFMFSGQGSQYVGMARDLYVHEPVFREQVDACSEALKPHLGLDLRDVLYPAAGREEWAAGQLAQTALTQPALFTIEYALAKLWRHWGIAPQAMIGHSSGEYVAACLADVFLLEDALALVAARGRLMQQMPPGSMLAVSLSEEAVQPYLDADLAVAALNSPGNCVISGPHAAVDALQARLDADEIACRRLHTSHAFHSAMMEPVIAPFRAQVQRVRRRPPAIPYISNLTGTWVTPEQATDPDYWCLHLRSAVRFSDGARALLQNSEAILLEVGPGNTLETLARAHLNRETPAVVVASLRHPRVQQHDVATVLNALGRLWLAGVEPDWEAFYAGEERRRVPLPAYPFERQRCWVEPKEPLAHGKVASAASADRKLPVERWFYHPAWQQTAPPTTPDSSGAERWLILLPAAGSEPDSSRDQLPARLLSALSATGRAVVTARPGAAFACAGGAYTLNPQRREDYVALLDAMAQSGGLPTHIVHLWGLAQLPAGDGALDAAQALGVDSLLALAQALDAQNAAGPVKLTVVTDGVYAATGDEPLTPEKAPVAGACKVLPQEYSALVCKHVDVTLPPAGSWRLAQLAAHLLAECASPQATDASVAYRGESRWIQRFAPVSIQPAPLRLRPDGVYVITGGLGDVGYALAQALVRHGAKRLVLIGRTALPARAAWDACLSGQPADNHISRRIARIRALEASGAQVLPLNADVADAAQMARAVAQTRERFGPITGVIHAAGLVGRATFRAAADTGPADVRSHLQAKMRGVMVLEAVLKDEPLDFCLLTSSLSTVLGGLGLSAYAAANAGMDALAYRRNRASAMPWISINWDAWQTTTEEYAAAGNPFAGLAIEEAEGGAALAYILGAGPASQILVSTSNLEARLDRWVRLPAAVAVEEKPDAAEAQTVSAPRPNLQNAYVAPRDDLERKLARVWQKALGLEQVGIYDNFFELGGNSLVGVELIAQLKKQWQIHIPAVSLYEAPTIHALAPVVRAALPGEPAHQESGPAYADSRSRGERRRMKAESRRQKDEA